jgi:large subunit ribosomal protein L15e
MYKYLQKAWKKPSKELLRSRLIEWRKEPSVLRLEHPTRLDRARNLGYKSKQGIIIARVKVLRGGRQRPLIKKGRKPRKRRRKLILFQNYRTVSEKRAAKHFKNLEVLNSYFIAKDGKHAWHEVILVDPSHPRIKSDKQLNWIGKGANKRRVTRGLTSSSKKSRGLRKKGKGTEKLRSSKAANFRKKVKSNPKT